MATTSVRWATTKELCDLIRAEPSAAGVTVEPGWPGDQAITTEMIWVDDISGDQDIPVFTGGRMHRDDMFTVTFLLRVSGLSDLTATMDRLEELAGIVEDVLADDPTLGSLTSIVKAEVSGTDMTAGRTPEGVIGFGRYRVSIHARLT